MKKLALGALFAGLLAACGGGSDSKKIVIQPDGSGGSNGSGGMCNPLSQAGCDTGQKCSWIIDQLTPTYVGHVGCVADGTAAVGASCSYGAAGATGYDDCTKGGVCSSFTSSGSANGICKAVCDNQGGDPMCDANHVCVTYSKLFSTGASSPAAAGVCDLACNPLTDNDFDGSGSASHKTTSTCGSNARIGCYGAPSGGTPPVTGWSCTGDINTGSNGSDSGFRHRTKCTTANMCADTDGTIYLNSCNQGYEPLFYDMTGSTVVDCIAFCKPLDCYAGNCGSNNANRLGEVGNRCNPVDRVGSFNVAANREECEYLWDSEVDGSGNILISPTSNSVGFCFDHGAYKYDPTGGSNPTIPYPGCEQLQLHGLDEGSGSADPSMPLTYFGAVDFGCVSTTTAGFGSAAGKTQPLHITIDKPRFLYHRVVGTN